MIDCAAILAGGLGTRLRPVVNERPKVMAMVAGRPFITRLLDQLAKSGVGRVVLCTGYMAQLISSELGDRYGGMELVYSVEETPLGTGGALRNATRMLSGSMFLALNGDSYCDCNIMDFIAGQASSGAGSGIVLANVRDVSRFGAVVTNQASLVESFVEKGNLTGPGWINAGIYLLPSSLIREIPPNLMVSLEREIFPPLTTQGLYGHHCTGSFIDIGIPEEYERSQKFFSGQTEGSP